MAEKEKNKGQSTHDTLRAAEVPSEEYETDATTDAEGPIKTPKVKNIERILDINLELTVKIGDLKMKLKDVLDLHPGAILEIEKNADSPLDLQVGNKILASGEVVTVGENLGLRINKK